MATAGSLTDVQRGTAEAMVEGLGPAELTKARRDDSGIDGFRSRRSTLLDFHTYFVVTNRAWSVLQLQYRMSTVSLLSGQGQVSYPQDISDHHFQNKTSSGERLLKPSCCVIKLGLIALAVSVHGLSFYLAFRRVILVLLVSLFRAFSTGIEWKSNFSGYYFEGRMFCCVYITSCHFNDTRSHDLLFR